MMARQTKASPPAPVGVREGAVGAPRPLPGPACRPSGVAGLTNSFQERVRAQFRKTQLCKYYDTLAGCAKGTHCPYAHGAHELLAQPDLLKTSLCKDFANGRCALDAERCPFAHGREDLRVTFNFEGGRARRMKAARRLRATSHEADPSHEDVSLEARQPPTTPTAAAAELGGETPPAASVYTGPLSQMAVRPSVHSENTFTVPVPPTSPSTLLPVSRQGACGVPEARMTFATAPIGANGLPVQVAGPCLLGAESSQFKAPTCVATQSGTVYRTEPSSFKAGAEVVLAPSNFAGPPPQIQPLSPLGTPRDSEPQPLVGLPPQQLSPVVGYVGWPSACASSGCPAGQATPGFPGTPLGPVPGVLLCGGALLDANSMPNGLAPAQLPASPNQGLAVLVWPPIAGLVQVGWDVRTGFQEVLGVPMPAAAPFLPSSSHHHHQAGAGGAAHAPSHPATSQTGTLLIPFCAGTSPGGGLEANIAPMAPFMATVKGTGDADVGVGTGVFGNQAASTGAGGPCRGFPRGTAGNAPNFFGGSAPHMAEREVRCPEVPLPPEAWADMLLEAMPDHYED